MVPVALINFDNVIEQNWDLTIVKVRFLCPPLLYIRPQQHLGLSIYRRYKSRRTHRPPCRLRHQSDAQSNLTFIVRNSASRLPH